MYGARYGECAAFPIPVSRVSMIIDHIIMGYYYVNHTAHILHHKTHKIQDTNNKPTLLPALILRTYLGNCTGLTILYNYPNELPKRSHVMNKHPRLPSYRLTMNYFAHVSCVQGTGCVYSQRVQPSLAESSDRIAELGIWIVLNDKTSSDSTSRSTPAFQN